MQNSLTTIQDVKDWAISNDAPYWRLFSGYIGAPNNHFIESNMINSDMKTSMEQLEKALKRSSRGYGGAFNVLLNKKPEPKDNAGARMNVELQAEGVNTPSVHGIGNVQSNESIEARIQKEVKQALEIQKKEYEHKAEIENLKAEIQGIKEETQSAWSFEKINGIVDTALQNPLVQMVMAKAFGLSGLPDLAKVSGNPTSDYETLENQEEEQIARAIDIVYDSGVGRAGDIFLGVAEWIKQNPDQARVFVNQLKATQANG